MLARFRIATKIYALVGVLVIACGAIGVYLVVAIKSTDARYTELLDRKVMLALKAERARGDIANMGRQFNNVLLLQDPKGLPTLKVSIGDMKSKVEMNLKAARGLSTGTRLDQINQALANMEQVDRVSVSVYAAKERLDHVAASDLYGREGRPTLVGTYEALAKLSDALVSEVEQGSSAAAEATDRASAMAIAALLCTMLASAILAAVVAVFGITRPISRLNAAMGRLATNELATDVPGLDRRDDVGAMSKAVQVFKDNLIRTCALEEETALARADAEEQRKRAMRDMANAFEQAVGGIVDRVSSSATELQATAQTMTATATQTSAQSTNVAAAAEEASANVSTVAAAAEELGGSVSEIGRQVQGSATLAQDAVTEADMTARLVQELSGAVTKIGDVVGLISNIASQTNLLALNATIEAARAGEAGRGFAVVASEVKELASQTARATEEISGQIGQIQGVTGQAVSAIGAITSRIREINTVASSIAAAVEEQGAATQEIVRNVSQAATGTGEVTTNIAGVASAAEESGAAAAQVLASASELSREAEHLSAEVGNFLATVRAA